MPFVKRPDERLDISLDFSDVLSTGERIAMVRAVEILESFTVRTEQKPLAKGDMLSLTIAGSDEKATKEFAVEGAGKATLIVQTGDLVRTSEAVLVAGSVGIGQGVDETRVVIGVQDGTPGKEYVIRAVIETENGRIYEKRDILTVRAD